MGATASRELISVTLLNPVTDHTGIPLYRQIASQLTELIEEFAPGTQLPSETSLSKHFGVSRATAVQAIRVLVEQGLIVRQQGSGTFVAERTSVFRRNAVGLTSFSDDLRRAGYETSARVLSSTVLAGVGPRGSEHPTGMGPVWKLERIICADNLPVVYVRSHLPKRVMPADIDRLTHLSLYEYLRTSHPAEEPMGVTEYWEAATAGAEVATALAVSADAAVMRVRRTAYTAADDVIEFSDSYVRSDVFRVRLVLGIRRGESVSSRSLVE